MYYLNIFILLNDISQFFFDIRVCLSTHRGSAYVCKCVIAPSFRIVEEYTRDRPARCQHDVSKNVRSYTHTHTHGRLSRVFFQHFVRPCVTSKDEKNIPIRHTVTVSHVGGGAPRLTVVYPLTYARPARPGGVASRIPTVGKRMVFFRPLLFQISIEW